MGEPTAAKMGIGEPWLEGVVEVVAAKVAEAGRGPTESDREEGAEPADSEPAAKIASPAAQSKTCSQPRPDRLFVLKPAMKMMVAARSAV